MNWSKRLVQTRWYSEVSVKYIGTFRNLYQKLCDTKIQATVTAQIEKNIYENVTPKIYSESVRSHETKSETIIRFPMRPYISHSVDLNIWWWKGLHRQPILQCKLHAVAFVVQIELIAATTANAVFAVCTISFCPESKTKQLVSANKYEELLRILFFRR